MTDAFFDQTLPVRTAGGEVPTALLAPASREGAGLVLVQEIFGVSTYIRQRAHDLAALGYTVAVPNLYWREVPDVVADDDPEALAKGMGLMQATDWDTAVGEVQASVAALREHPGTGGRVGVIGFCYGGGLAYAAAATASGTAVPDALVSYYGSALPMLVDHVATPKVPQLHHFGDSDAFIPIDQVAHVAEVVAAGPDTAFHLHPGAGHAFDNPSPAFHHAGASAEAWRATVDWLAGHFPASARSAG